MVVVCTASWEHTEKYVTKYIFQQFISYFVSGADKSKSDLFHYFIYYFRGKYMIYKHTGHKTLFSDISRPRLRGVGASRKQYLGEKRWKK